MSLKRSIVFCLRFLARPGMTLNWLIFLGDFARQNALGCPHDDLVRKSLGTFFVHGASARDRLKLLTNHFRIAAEVLTPEILRALWRGHVIDVRTIEGRSESYRVQLLLADHCGSRHEGVFALRLSRVRDGYALCTAGFIFVRSGYTGISVAIGGIQGPKAIDAKRALITATRCLGGLRPKDAVLLALQGLVSNGGSGHFMAVSNARHVINQRRRKRRRMMHVDMDGYWVDRGGEPAAPFGFRVPIKPAPPAQGANRREQAKLAFWQAASPLLSKPACSE
ncbi:DUF535 family protein [Mesorhizobium sp.]|uniref:DUF535 family protein n=1 Tax=Mesorhizobium sp. TaxID=1871066 RepID=UPI003BAC7BF6